MFCDSKFASCQRISGWGEINLISIVLVKIYVKGWKRKCVRHKQKGLKKNNVLGTSKKAIKGEKKVREYV